MDAATIAALVPQVIAILTPFVGKAGEAIATKAGEAVFAQGQRIYNAIHVRFSKESDGGKASKVLQNFADDPEEYQINLQNKLAALLQTDPDFAATLNQIMQSGPIQHIELSDNSLAEGNQMKNTARQGSQTIRAEKGSTAKDNSMEIG